MRHLRSSLFLRDAFPTMKSFFVVAYKSFRENSSKFYEFFQCGAVVSHKMCMLCWQLALYFRLDSSLNFFSNASDISFSKVIKK